MKWLPNALTILRCVLAFVVGWAILEMTVGQVAFDIDIKVNGISEAERAALRSAKADHVRYWSFVAPISFISGAILDFFDGWLARRWNAESAFGRLLDPIADKLLVGIPLIIAGALAVTQPLAGLAVVIPAFAIVLRDLAITLLRFSRIGGNATIVSKLAKWKTAIEFLTIGLPLVSIALVFDPDIHHFNAVSLGPPLALSLVLLWLAAALSLYTGYQYVRAAFSRPAP